MKPLFVIAGKSEVDPPGEVTLRPHFEGVGLFIDDTLVCAVGVKGRRVIDLYGGVVHIGLEEDSEGWVKTRTWDSPE